MGLKYLWDTNTVIYYLQQLYPPAAEKAMDDILRHFQPALSVITEIELRCWKGPSPEDLHIIKKFTHDGHLFELDTAIKERTIGIRRSFRIKLADAIIAATALEQDLILITRNTKDFQEIKGLRLLNPWET